jgi:hypothetical protein
MLPIFNFSAGLISPDLDSDRAMGLGPKTTIDPHPAGETLKLT